VSVWWENEALLFFWAVSSLWYFMYMHKCLMYLSLERERMLLLWENLVSKSDFHPCKLGLQNLQMTYMCSCVRDDTGTYWELFQALIDSYLLLIMQYERVCNPREWTLISELCLYDAALRIGKHNWNCQLQIPGSRLRCVREFKRVHVKICWKKNLFSWHRSHKAATWTLLFCRRPHTE
jgi:hypothetical protein